MNFVHTKSYISWTTIFLHIIATIGSIVSIMLGLGIIFPEYKSFNLLEDSLIGQYFKLPLMLICISLSSFCSYVQFTIGHDAVHGSVSKNKKINDLIGWSAQFWLGPTSSFLGFKHVHLAHHTYTNDPNLDPDIWCSSHSYGGRSFILLRWATIDIYYNYKYISVLFNKSKYEIIISCISIIINMSFILCSIKYEFFHILFQYWIIPSRIAQFVLAYTFDYLPHDPHIIKKKENKYHTTSYISINKLLKPVLSILMFYQNYHIIHHLYPNIPFYKYKSLWNNKCYELINDKNIKIKRVLSWINVGGEEELPIKKQ